MKNDKKISNYNGQKETENRDFFPILSFLPQEIEKEHNLV